MEIFLKDTRAAAAMTGLTVSTLTKMRVYGGGPKFCRLGRSVRYRDCDLNDWIAASVVSSTSEKVAA